MWSPGKPGCWKRVGIKPYCNSILNGLTGGRENRGPEARKLQCSDEWILDKGNHQEQFIIIQHTQGHVRGKHSHPKSCSQKSANELTLMKTRGLEAGWWQEERRGCCITCPSCPDLPMQLDSDLQDHHFSCLGLLNLRAAPLSDLPNLCYPNFSPFEQLDKGPTCAVASHYAPKGEYNEA